MITITHVRNVAVTIRQDANAHCCGTVLFCPRSCDAYIIADHDNNLIDTRSIEAGRMFDVLGKMYTRAVWREGAGHSNKKSAVSRE